MGRGGGCVQMRHFGSSTKLQNNTSESISFYLLLWSWFADYDDLVSTLTERSVYLLRARDKNGKHELLSAHWMAIKHARTTTLNTSVTSNGHWMCQFERTVQNTKCKMSNVIYVHFSLFYFNSTITLLFACLFVFQLESKLTLPHSREAYIKEYFNFNRSMFEKKKLILE